MNASESRLLAGRYELGQTLGRGGMAEVIEAHDMRLGRRVAIKMLRTDLAADPAFHSRFQREAQAAASLNHPNIVAVYDTGEDFLPGADTLIPFIVMEYVDGVTLRQLLHSGRRIMPERAVEITMGVLAALDYSHRHGIIHRDIKPGNVMLTRTGDVKVMDFGIARALADQAQTMTQTSAVLGTASYLSPEQARGQVVDARSDIYSAGCVFYELLTGGAPFTGESPVAIAYQHVGEPVVPPSQVDPSLPAMVDNIMLTALAKRPDDRYATAAEFRSDLERLLAAGDLAGAGGARATVSSAPVTTQVTAPTAPVGRIPSGGGGGAAIGEQQTAVMPRVEDYDDEPQQRSPWLWVGLTLAVVAVVAGLIIIGRTLFNAANPGDVAVPNIVGLTVSEAENALSDVGLVLGERIDAVSDTVPEGRIISQDPGADSSAAPGTRITITVSSGAEQAVVPDLIDLLSVEAARAQLQASGLELGRVREVSSEKPAGQVVSQDPVAGASLPVGSLVDIEVSAGTAVIPDVVNRTRAQALAILTNAGFQVVVEEQVDPVVPPGTVLAQAPEAGSEGKQGSVVSIVVAVSSMTPPDETLSPDQPQQGP